MNKQRVIVAMSGGVDSAVAALLLKQRGYEVIGMTLRLWSTDDPDGNNARNNRCCSVEDVDDARNVCNMLGIPHYFVNFEKEFQEHVVDYFISEYDSGRTPHPCLACNDKIKFDFLLRRALFLEADFIATGHYARLKEDNGKIRLLKGVDQSKDQSYVLYTLKQPELTSLKFPVGTYTKTEIRQLAQEANLPVANKPDSQEICFIPSGNYREFLQDRIEAKPGSFVNRYGEILGDHPGIQFFTIGQRRKLGLPSTGGEPMFVLGIDPSSNQVILGSEQDLYQREFYCNKLSFTRDEYSESELHVSARIRYKASEAQAAISMKNGRGLVRFTEPQRAITPGQPVVFYRDQEMVGGGIIESPAFNSITRPEIDQVPLLR
ncbi:MAG: tRNA 2-thiouridine(34) synthase MnmA [SAR202 cluster bacterium]|nr:tRNA 2-thiouridine(34) synthase MnmA [SAR202 cluster bacterium]